MRHLPALMVILLFTGGQPCEKDMGFGIEYKGVDGSWEGSLYWDLPHDSKITIQNREGSYYLAYSSECKGGMPGMLRNAAIDFRVISKKMLYDTTKTKVDLVEPDTLK